MLKNILSRIQKNPVENNEDVSSRIKIATAVILLEVAHADDDFSTQEQNRIIKILSNEFQLDKEDVDELIEASEQKRKQTVDLWHFTKIINDNFNDAEKSRIIDYIWQVIFADGRLDKYEDYIVHKLSTILHVPHSAMIQAKLKHLPKNKS